MTQRSERRLRQPKRSRPCLRRKRSAVPRRSLSWAKSKGSGWHKEKDDTSWAATSRIAVE